MSEAQTHGGGGTEEVYRNIGELQETKDKKGEQHLPRRIENLLEEVRQFNVSSRMTSHVDDASKHNLLDTIATQYPRDEIEQLGKKVKEMEDRTGRTEAEIKDLNEGVKELTKDINTFEGDVESLEGDVESLEGDVESLEGDVEDVRNSINEKISETFARRISGPLVLGIGIFASLTGLFEAVSMSFRAVPLLGIGAFALYIYLKIRNRFGLSTREMI